MKPYASSTKLSRRVLSFAMAAVMTLGLIPSTIIPAHAAGGQNSLQEQIASTGSATITLSLDHLQNPSIATENNTIAGNWIGSYTDAGGGKGLAYCINHDKGAPNNGRPSQMKVKPSSVLESNTLLRNTYMIGYNETRKGPGYYKLICALVQKYFPEVAGDIAVGWAETMTEEEWRKATQFAIWMCTETGDGRTGLSIEGQVGRKGFDKNAKEYILMSRNPSASATRVLKAAKCLYAYGTWLTDTANFDFATRKVGIMDAPMAEKQFARMQLWDETTKTLDFKSLGKNKNDGTLADAAEEFPNFVYEQNVGGKNYYVIDWVVASKTQLRTAFDVKLSGNPPADAVLGYYIEDEVRNHLADNFDMGMIEFKEGDNSGNYVWNSPIWHDSEAPNPKKNISIMDSYFAAGNNHVSEEYGCPEPGGAKTAHAAYFKVMVPVEQAKDTGSLQVKIDANAYNYAMYLAEMEPSNPMVQGFIVADTVAPISTASNIIWGGAEGQKLEDDEEEDDEITYQGIIKKISMDGEALKGTVFHFEGIDNGSSFDKETDSFGVIDDIQWVDPKKPNYVFPGSYMVTEIKPTPGYNLDDSGPKTLLLNPDGTSSGPLIFKNSKKPNIKIIKVDEQGKPLAGAFFDVWKDGKYLGNVGPTLDNGEIEFSDVENEGLTNGYYEFQETQAPPGYIVDREKKGIHVNVNSVDTPNMLVGEVKFTNHKYPSITIVKQDKETGAKLPGAVFEVRIDGEVFRDQIATDENGEINFTYEELKDFLDANEGLKDKTSWTITVTELKAPEGYNKDKQKENTYTLTQELKLGEAIEPFVFEDTSFRSVKVTKRDAKTEWPLKGARFLLESVSLDDGEGTFRKELVTDEAGFVIFEDVPNGTYRLSELAPPYGYEPNDEVMTVRVTSDDEPQIEFTYKNEPKSGIRILKVDAATDQPIKGAVFLIEPLLPLSAPKFERTTDDNGLIILEDLEKGTYKITEISVPAPYVVDPTPQSIEVDDQHDSYQVTFRNFAKGMVYIQKLDGVTQEPLAGAYFDIHTAGGKHVATVGPTGPNGFVTWSGLEPGGSYVVKEIKAPNGHIIDPTPQSFEVDETDSGKIYTLIFDNMPKANLWLQKIDADTGLGLEGAVFKITKGNGEIVRENVKTDKGGFLKVNGLEEGTYQIIETKAPEGYVLDSTPRIVTLHYESTEVIIIENVKHGSLSIRKVDAATGAPLAGASFQLYDVADKPIGLPKTSGKDGYVRWSNLEAGFYMVKEVSAPEGYVVDPTVRKFEVKSFETTEFEWKNTQNATVTIVKKDGETLEPLSGATFEIRKLNGTVVDSITTDLSGSATSKQLDLGWYVVVETKAPTGYVLNPEETKVEVKAGTPVVIEKTNVKSKGVIIHKVDAITKEPLAGAVFELQTIDGKLIDKAYTTDASGTATTAAVQPGMYYLVETKAPDGYILKEDKVLVEVEEDMASSVTIENQPKSVIQIYKTDAVTGDPLAGVEFEISRYNGKVIEIVTTDKTGYAYSQVVEPGEYVVKETKAAPGYVLDSTEHRATVVAGENTILRLKNTPDTALHITKIDKDTRAPIAGVVFQVEKVCGVEPCIIVGQYTTDEYGHAVTEPLEPGIYRVKELSTPPTHVKDDTVHEVCVKAGEYNNIIIENQAAATLIARKIDSKTGKPIAGAVFKLETADHSLIGTMESDANGEALFVGLKAGHYIVTETQAPPGYQISSPASQTITVKYGINNYCDFVDAQNGSLVIILQDKHTGEYLPGGEFVVIRESDQTVVFDASTDITGTLVVGDLKPGWYTVKQVFAPDEYTMVDIEKKVEILAGTQQTLYFKDETASLVIEKVNAKDPDQMLEGARFKVTRESDGIVVGEYETNSDGLAMCYGLKAGRYTVEEIVAPTGFVLNQEPQTIEVKGGTSAHVTFTNMPKASITVNVVDKDTKAPISGAIVEVWKQNGALVNTFTSDTTGVIETLKLEPGYYVLKFIKAPDGYTATVTETTVQVIDGEEATFTFECVANGILKVISTNKDDVAIPGMKFEIRTIDGTEVGSYVTGQNGTYTVSSLPAGWYIITETKAPEGFNITTQSQKVEVKAGETATVTFQHSKTYGLQIRTTCQQTGAPVEGVVYEITELNGAMVGTFTSDASGLCFAELTPGWYVVTQKSVPNGYTAIDSTPRTIQVKGDSLTVADFLVSQLSGLRVKVVDGMTGKGLYGVRLLLKNGTQNIKEYTTNNEGYIKLNQAIVSGGYTLEMISVPDGYRVDTVPKSIDILNAQTTEIVWKLYKDAGQIQVAVTSADYNKTLDLPAGAGLQGAVFEVTNADTYQVMCQMISDSSGIAASSGLPIGRYFVKMIKGPAYYACSDQQIEVRLKINNDVVRTEMQCKSVNLATSITQKTNTSVRAGSSMRVDILTADNLSDARLDNFNVHIKVPTDAARISSLNVGTWNQAVWYKISYKTNMNDYRALATNLLSTSKYSFDLSSQSLGLMAGEYTTDIRLEFGTVPAGFKVTSKSAYSLYVLATTYNGYKLINRIEMSGQYNATTVSTNHVTSPWGPADGNNANLSGSWNGTAGAPAISGNSGQWATNASVWTTTVTSNVKMPSTLPKTGY